MTNAELINVLRKCGDEPYDITKPCKVSPWKLMLDAADALEAADRLLDQNTKRCETLRKQLREAHESYEKHINELEAQLPKEGEWIESEDLESAMKGKVVCSICGEPQFALELTNEFVRMKNSKTNYCPNCGAKMKGEQE